MSSQEQSDRGRGGQPPWPVVGVWSLYFTISIAQFGVGWGVSELADWLTKSQAPPTPREWGWMTRLTCIVALFSGLMAMLQFMGRSIGEANDHSELPIVHWWRPGVWIALRVLPALLLLMVFGSLIESFLGNVFQFAFVFIGILFVLECCYVASPLFVARRLTARRAIIPPHPPLAHVLNTGDQNVTRSAGGAA